MLVIVAPFYILLGVALPNFGGFGGWFKSFISTLAIFPVVGITILFAHFMLWSTTPSSSWLAAGPALNPFQFQTNQLPTQPYLELPTFGSGTPASLIGFFGSIVVVLAIPSIANSIKSFVASGRAGPVQPELGFGGALIGAPVGMARREISKTAGAVAGGYGAMVSNSVFRRLPPNVQERARTAYTKLSETNTAAKEATANAARQGNKRTG